MMWAERLMRGVIDELKHRTSIFKVLTHPTHLFSPIFLSLLSLPCFSSLSPL